MFCYGAGARPADPGHQYQPRGALWDRCYRFNYGNGYHSQTGGYLNYAHHIMFSRSATVLNQLSFGLSAGMSQQRLDETAFSLEDYNPVIAVILQSTSYFNLDAGVSYNFFGFLGTWYGEEHHLSE